MDIKYLKGVGEKRANAFSKIGINKLEDFLKFIPRSYINKILIKDIQKYNDTNVIVSGRIIDIDYPKKINHPLRVFLNDGTGTTEISIFGRSE